MWVSDWGSPLVVEVTLFQHTLRRVVTPGIYAREVDTGSNSLFFLAELARVAGVCDGILPELPHRFSCLAIAAVELEYSRKSEGAGG